MVTRPRNLAQADPYFDSVVLLAPLSGEDGDTSASDLSNSTHTLTFSGNAVLDGDIRKFGFTSSSLPATGSNSYIDTNSTADLALGTGDFTIEFHVNFDSFLESTWQGLFDQRTTPTQVRPAIYINSSNTLSYYVNGATRITGPNTSSLSTNTWYHIAVCRSSSTTKMFVDGTQVGLDYSDSNNYSQERVRIGGLGNDTGYPTRGWIENVRVTKGVARYTTAFTPPERAYPTVQNVDGIYQLPDTSTITFDSESSSLSGAGYIVDFVFNEDGTQWSFTDDGGGGGGTGEIQYAPVSPAYDVTGFSTVETPIDTTLGRLRGIQWSSDGTQLYVSDYSDADINSFDVSPAYDISSISLTPDATFNTGIGVSNLLGFHFTDDGKYCIFGRDNATLYLFELSTAWDITTMGSEQNASFSASGVTRCDQAIISNDGTRIWQLGLNTEKIHQWTLSTPFDLSTASWDGAGKDFALQNAGSYVNPTGMTLLGDRNELYVTWTLSSYRVQKYTIG